MAEYELIQERLISGKGVLRIPEDKRKNRTFTLYLSVIRQPINRYLNRNYTPARGKYAFLVFLRNGYVISDASMEYEQQSYDSVADVAGQTLIALKCAYEGILVSFANLGISLGHTITQYNDLIKDYENLNLNWTQVNISCYADTAIQARLYRLKYDSCDPSKDNDKPPPPPPPPLPPVPPGTGIPEVNSPYDEDSVTDPYPLDKPIIPLLRTYTWTDPNADNMTRTAQGDSYQLYDVDFCKSGKRAIRVFNGSDEVLYSCVIESTITIS